MPTQKISEEDLVDLHGKVALVTGGNTGIGYATIQMLARKGAKVYMGARDQGRAEAAIKQLESEDINDGSVHWLKLDLTDPRAARAAAKELLEKEKRLDILVNNAAMGPTGALKFDKNGLLDIMVINHFSPFVLTDTLLPLLKETARKSGTDVRIVNLASPAHSWAKPTTLSTKEEINKDYGGYTGAKLSAYGHSKLVNILHIKELQKRLNAASVPITCMAVDPGSVATQGVDTFLTSVPYFSWVLKNVLHPLVSVPWRQGAMPVAFAAAGKEVSGQTARYQGAYVVPIAAVGTPSSFAQDERLQKELYDTTESLMAELF
ncbi:NAD-P-binding protein [Mycena maculata]|uniref:NAD-P-binding protein n=1 Tax=Mycena maculata TaxID=230809 RepID=A0AAD7I5T9_9AGAR|nr:NAD-P-binding protein [Mycena maculata]